MGFLSANLNPASSATMGNKLGGLTPKVALDAVKKIIEKSGDAVVDTAEFCRILPQHDQLIQFVSEQADRFEFGDLCQQLINDEAALTAAWKEVNRSDWEEFILEDQPTDLTKYYPLIETAKRDKALERAIQAAAEYRFPRLYLLRCIAIGITATEESWSTRAKINAFRNFFLRLALPGGKYDKYISYYIILTSEKDAWDEMRFGQNSKFGFFVDSVANLGSVKLSSFFEKKLERLLSDKFKELTGATSGVAAAGTAVAGTAAVAGVGIIPGRGRNISGLDLEPEEVACCPRCGRRLPPKRQNWCMYCGWEA